MTLETTIFQSEMCLSYLSASLQATGNVRGCAETPGLPRSWPDVHTWAFRAWLSGFGTYPKIILLNQKIFK